MTEIVKDFPSFDGVLALKESGIKDIWVYLEGKYGIDRERLRGWFRREQERRNKNAEAVIAEDTSADSNPEKEFKAEKTMAFDDFGGVKSVSSKRILMMTEEQEKDVEYVLKAHGFNPSEWTVVNLISNFWEGLQKGGFNTTALYQSKLTVKPKSENKNITKEDVLAWYEEMGNTKALTFSEKEIVDSERMLLIPLADFHFGNGNNTHHMDDIVFQATKKLAQTDIDEIWIVNIGDLLHIDNYDGQTTAGTQVGTRGTIYNIWKTAVNELIYLISALRAQFKGVIRFSSVSGNHDRVNSFTAANALAFYFNHDEDILFDVDFEERKYYKYGNSTLGFAHGDIPNKNMQTVIQREAKHFYGETIFAYMFFGHLHHIFHQDKDGVIMYQLPSPTPVDEWHNQKAYTGSWRGTQMFLIDYQSGVEEIIYVAV